MFSSSCSIRNDFQSGEFQHAWSHDGTDNAVEWVGHPVLADQPFTIMFWYTGSPLFHLTGMRHPTSGKYWGLQAGLDVSIKTMDFDLSSLAGFRSRQSSWNTQWAHMCISADRSGNAIGYYNGKPVDTSATGHRDAVLDTNLEAYAGVGGGAPDVKKSGRNLGTSSDYIVGKIGEFVAYDTNLNAAQVRACYNGAEPYDHKNGAAAANLTYWQRCNPGMRRADTNCPTGNRSGSSHIIDRDFDSAKYAKPENFSDSDIVSASVGKNA